MEESIMTVNQPFCFLFTADVHGNPYQYLIALWKAFDLRLDGVVFGGDISPKEGNSRDGAHWKLGHRTRTPQAQRRFYEDWMIPLFSGFTRATRIPIFTMMGNDDFSVNMDLLEDTDAQGALRLLHERAHALPNGLWIAGESFVSLTPFANKDWEKWDESSPNALVAHRNRLEGHISTKDGFVETDFRSIPRSDSMEARLFDGVRHLSDPAKTIYVFHDPPFGTHLDQLTDGTHVGSRAVRRYVEEVGGRLGLHGHIHETVEASGHFRDRVGNTLVAAPGNDPFNHPTGYYADYRRALYALVVSASPESVTVDRISPKFSEVDFGKAPPIFRRYTKVQQAGGSQ